MERRDLYCFKSGKLELSILDEGSEEKAEDHLSEEKGMTYISLDAQEELKEGDIQPREPQLMITEDITHTLKTMGAFLTQADYIESEDSYRDDGSKTQGEEVSDINAEISPEYDLTLADSQQCTEESSMTWGKASIEDENKEDENDHCGKTISLDVEDDYEEFSKPLSKPLSEEAAKSSINLKDEIVVEIDDLEDETKGNPKNAQDDKQQSCIRSIDTEIEESQNTSSRSEASSINLLEETNQLDSISDFIKIEVSRSNTPLQQSVIDDILLSHFGEVTSKYPFARELKQKIEKQIFRIKSNKY